MTDNDVPFHSKLVSVDNADPAPQYVVTIGPAIEGALSQDGTPIATIQFQCATMMLGMMAHEKMLPHLEKINLLSYVHGVQETRHHVLAAMIAAECTRASDPKFNELEVLKHITERVLSILLGSSGPVDPSLN